MLITLHMFSLSVVCTLNTQLKLLPFKRYTVLRRTVNGNFILSPTVVYLEGGTRPLLLGVYRQGDSCINSMQPSEKLDTNADSVGTLDMTPHTQRRQPGKRYVPISPAQAIIAPRLSFPTFNMIISTWMWPVSLA